ncbi:MAG: PQQ-like beta-propeller repeat protein [Planctomycetes bacterium]|nr:PQQ-like beta-propeller repeat protein [Planctomycetota bacterium]
MMNRPARTWQGHCLWCHRRRQGGLVWATVAAVAAGVGCQTPGRPLADRDRPHPIAQTTMAEPPAAPDLDQQYIIGPTAARELGYRIHFQTQTFPQDNSGLRQFAIQQDSVFTLDGRNFLTRLHREDGQRLWRIPVADPLDEIHGITLLGQVERVFLTVGANVLVLDADTGSQIAKQRLGQIANTAPVVFAPFFIYGARNGQLVWHSYEVGYQWRGYQIASSIRIQPLLIDGSVITIGTDGRIVALDASSATGRWDKQLLNTVAAAPVAGGGMVYVAGLDQHVWAFDLATGRNVWRYLTESPLTDSPILIADRLYQQIPSEGLVCFDARPIDAPGGEVIWTAPNVAGNVIGRYRNRVMVWDKASRQLTLVDAGQGNVIKSIDLPQVRHLLASRMQAGDLYAAGDDGRVIRLVPRN